MKVQGLNNGTNKGSPEQTSFLREFPRRFSSKTGLIPKQYGVDPESFPHPISFLLADIKDASFQLKHLLTVQYSETCVKGSGDWQEL